MTAPTNAVAAATAAQLPLPLDSVNEDIEAALDDFLLQLPSFDDDSDVLGGGGGPLPAVYAPPQAMTVDRASEAGGGGVGVPGGLDPLLNTINNIQAAAAAAVAAAPVAAPRRPSPSSKTPPPSSSAPAATQRPSRGPSLAAQQGAAPANGKTSTLERNREAQRRFRERQRSRVGQLERAAADAAAREGALRAELASARARIAELEVALDRTGPGLLDGSLLASELVNPGGARAQAAAALAAAEGSSALPQMPPLAAAEENGNGNGNGAPAAFSDCPSDKQMVAAVAASSGPAEGGNLARCLASSLKLTLESGVDGGAAGGVGASEGGSGGVGKGPGSATAETTTAAGRALCSPFSGSAAAGDQQGSAEPIELSPSQIRALSADEAVSFHHAFVAQLTAHLRVLDDPRAPRPRRAAATDAVGRLAKESLALYFRLLLSAPETWIELNDRLRSESDAAEASERGEGEQQQQQQPSSSGESGGRSAGGVTASPHSRHESSPSSSSGLPSPSSSPAPSSTLPTEADPRWAAVAEATRLTPEQRTAMVLLRRRLAADVAPLRERRAAAVRALAATLPPRSSGYEHTRQTMAAAEAIRELRLTMKCEVLARLTHTHELVNSLLTPVQVARSLVAGFPRPPDGLAVCLWVAAGEGDPDAVATLSAFGVGGFGGAGGEGTRQQPLLAGASPAEAAAAAAAAARNASLPLLPLPPFPNQPQQQQQQQQQNFTSALPMEDGGSNAVLDGGANAAAVAGTLCNGGGGSATITTGLE